jgi:hypothetical protein
MAQTVTYRLAPSWIAAGNGMKSGVNARSAACSGNLSAPENRGYPLAVASRSQEEKRPDALGGRETY